LRNIPELLAWGIGIVLGAIMVKRGGGRAEKLFLAGCCSMFAVSLINPLVLGLVRWWMSEPDRSYISIARIMGLASLPVAILGLVGVVCLIWAFYTKFWTRRPEAA